MKHTMMMRWARGFAGMLLAATLASCGGGGGGGCNKYEGCEPATSPDAIATITPSTLQLVLSKSSVTNTDVAPVVATASVSNSTGNAIVGIPVTYSVSGGVVSGVPPVTNQEGVSTANVRYTDDKSNRVVTVTAKAGNLEVSKTFVVSGVKLTATLLPAIVAPGGSGQLEVAVSDAQSNPLNDLTVSVSGTQLVSNSGPTVSGKFTYDYTVPVGFAGNLIPITISAAGVVEQALLTVQQTSGTPSIPVATGPLGAGTTLLADPAVVGVNAAGSTTNQTQIRLKVFNNLSTPLPIKNVRVSFDLAGDPNSVGGRFTAGSNVVYTAANGTASTTFIPGSTPTGTEGLQIRACYSLTDFTPDPEGDAPDGSIACPNFKYIPLIINGDAMKISIGPNALVGSAGVDATLYETKFAVQVANASGLALSGVKITPVLDVVGYEKGYWDKPPSGDWFQVLTLPGSTTYADVDVDGISYKGCANEDTDRDGVSTVGEDPDGDGLEPGKSDAVVSFIGSDLTDSTGAVALRVTYLKNVASWLRVKLYVKGTVSGTEGIGTLSLILRPPAGDVQGENRPAFADNPYGQGTSCTVH